MIQTETIDSLVHHYSDSGYRIRQIETGVLYDDAIDIQPCPYTYEETSIPAECFVPQEENLNEAARFLLTSRLVEMPGADEPDYFNENEAEPDYFA